MLNVNPLFSRKRTDGPDHAHEEVAGVNPLNIVIPVSVGATFFLFAAFLVKKKKKKNQFEQK